MEIHRKHWISPGVKRIDAAAPIDQVTRQIKRTLWHEL
jgi:hypothetical protein